MPTKSELIAKWDATYRMASECCANCQHFTFHTFIALHFCNVDGTGNPNDLDDAEELVFAQRENVCDLHEPRKAESNV